MSEGHPGFAREPTRRHVDELAAALDALATARAPSVIYFYLRHSQESGHPCPMKLSSPKLYAVLVQRAGRIGRKLSCGITLGRPELPLFPARYRAPGCF
jgi:hypothetical protein